MPSLLDLDLDNPGASLGLLGNAPGGGVGLLDASDAPRIAPPDDRTVSPGDAVAQSAQMLRDYLAKQQADAVQQGYWTGGQAWEGGHPTSKGLLDAAQQYGSSLVAGTAAPEAGAAASLLSPDAAPKLNPSALGFDDRISTRLPSKTPDVHDTADYTVDLPAFQSAQGPYLGRVAEALDRHPGVTDTSPEGFISHISDNLQALWDAVPGDWKAGAMNWYNGARTLAEQMADKYGTSVRAQAANLAALSPQRMWDHNVEQAGRVADAVANHANTPWNQGLEDAWNGTVAPDGTVTPGFAQTNPKWQPLYDQMVQGKSLGEIDDPQAAALWIRLHDRATADHQNVPIVKPDGTTGDFLTNNDGTPSALQWGNLGAIGNAVSSLRDDSLANISSNMGDAHKVRNFYNNIVSPDAGHDVTIDTHAIAAGLLRPLGSSNPEVSYGLGSPVLRDPYRLGDDPWPTTMDNAPAGLKGIYPLYAEAYRRVAAANGVLPRQLQSVTWEGIRGLYNDVDRRNGPLIQGNTDLWKAVSDGNATPDDARAEILGRGIRPPGWAGQ
jgi:hypothetical protein